MSSEEEENNNEENCKLKYSYLINESIITLKERTGLSLHAIKTYITTNYPHFNFQQVRIKNSSLLFFSSLLSSYHSFSPLCSMFLFYSIIFELQFIEVLKMELIFKLNLHIKLQQILKKV